MRDLASLNRRLERVADRLTRGIELLGTDIASEIGKAIVPATPVDTGFARGNWRPSINAPSPVPVSVLDPTGAATVGRITSVARLFRLGNTFYLVNRTPYIGQLNSGSSPQAPAGFVEAAIEEGVAAGLRKAADGLIARAGRL